MKCLSRWTTVMMCAAVVLAVAYAQGEGQRTSKTIFERFTRPVGQAQLEQPTKGTGQKMVSQRRIIVYDDGDPLSPQVNPQIAAEGVEGFLRWRFKPCLGTQVDSYFWNIGHGLMLPPTEKFDASLSKDANREFGTRVMIQAAHEADVEILASLKMNDSHDAYVGVKYPLKVQRPDLLIGDRYWPGQYPNLLPGEQGAHLGGYPEDSLLSWFFAALDYAEPEVRQHRLDFIDQFCRKYDFDGLELDYFRHPLFFKLGEEEENLDTMTEFVRQVRGILKEIGRERGRPYLLTARVPDSPAMARRTGLDVEQWLKEGSLDLLVIGGGYMPYSGRYKEFIDMAHRYGVPAYPCVNHFRGHEPIRLRSVGSNFWGLGGDGVYVFNYDGAKEGTEYQQCLSQMGSSETLLGLDKAYQPDTGCSIPYCGHVNPSSQLPVRLIGGTPIELVVGDDLAKAARQGILAEARLQVKVANVDESEGITIRVNGVSVPAESIGRVSEAGPVTALFSHYKAEGDTFEAVVTAPPVQRGINHITVLPGPGCIGRLSSTVTWVELLVRYQHD